MRTKIVFFIVVFCASFILTKETGYHKRLIETTFETPEAVAAIQPVHGPPSISSQNSKEWEDIYGYILSRNKKVYPKFAAEITDHILEYSEKYGVHPDIVVSIIAVESNFSYWSVSNKNAVGLMQVVYKYWKDDEDVDDILDEEDDLYDPELNIKVGCLILSKLKNQHKDIRKYLNAYYGGTGYYEKVSAEFSKFKLSTEYNDG